jgi:hypothetical protein
MARRAFATAHPLGFLLLHSSVEEEPSNAFATQAVGGAGKLPGSDDLNVRALAKQPDNPFPDHISVGRARNCDISIRHASVSKLHARFRVEGSQLSLIDAGSQNGTFRNGRRLVADEPSTVAYGDTLLFGSVSVKLVDAETLHELLTSAEHGSP